MTTRQIVDNLDKPISLAGGTTIIIPAGKLAATYPAYGGPVKAFISGDGFEAGPTDSGEYIIYGCWPHSSSRYKDWSGIPWGTPLRETIKGIEVKVKDHWELITKYSIVTKDDILAYHWQLFKRPGLPSTWVFNDFGHVTCYIYIDKNRNGKRDIASEGIHGEMFHTTPINEAQTALNQEVTLAESHGCIHIKPRDIDSMIEKGYLAKGNKVYVHDYKQSAKKVPIDTTAKAPFTVHFFPGNKIILILGR
jgi:hypothetical protein